MDLNLTETACYAGCVYLHVEKTMWCQEKKDAEICVSDLLALIMYRWGFLCYVCTYL